MNEELVQLELSCDEALALSDAFQWLTIGDDYPEIYDEIMLKLTMGMARVIQARITAASASDSASSDTAEALDDVATAAPTPVALPSTESD